MQIRGDTAIDAVQMIMYLVECADEEGPGAVELRLGPEVVKELRRLVCEINFWNKKVDG